MATKVECPFCAAVLRIPENSLGKKGRCRACGKVFTIPFIGPFSEESASDDEILTWLGEAAAARSGPGGQEKSRAQAPRLAGPTRREVPPRRGRAPKRYPVRLGHVDDMGAFFLFDPQVLYDVEFRSSFPPKCIVCAGTRQLSIHLVIWSSKLPGRGQFGMRDSYAPSVYELADMGGLRGPDILAKLDRVENLPVPYCLPFPYYVCHACSAVGAIVTDVRFAEGSTGQVCELGIASLKRAEEFAVAVCGRGSRVHRQIRLALEQGQEDPWRALPLAVRTRIRQWYTQQDGEQFVAYLPDGDFAKTEAGMAGIVLTDRRLVYRKFAAQIEMPLSERLTIARTKSGARTQLQISASGARTATFTAGPVGTERLRKVLAQRGVQTHWMV